jgi:hypothetical protein
MPHDLAWLIILTGFGLIVISYVTITMIAFSSLQRPVGGNANSPLAISLGALIILPTFYIQIASYDLTVLVEMGIPIFLGTISIMLLILSSRLSSPSYSFLSFSSTANEFDQANFLREKVAPVF